MLSLYFVDHKVTFHTDKITDLTANVPTFLAPYLVLVYPPKTTNKYETYGHVN